MHSRSHLDYCDFIYHIPELRDRPENGTDELLDDSSDFDDSVVNGNFESNFENDRDTNLVSNVRLNFQMRALESIQYQAGLAVTGAWKGSNSQKIYNELGWV